MDALSGSDDGGTVDAEKPTRFRKGGPGGPGRPKGKPNLNSRELKDAIATSFRRVGGARYLVKLAQDNPEIYCRLLGRLLPKESPAPQRPEGAPGPRDPLAIAVDIAFLLNHAKRAAEQRAAQQSAAERAAIDVTPTGPYDASDAS